MGIKSLGDATLLRAAAIAMLESASLESDAVRRKRILTFVMTSALGVARDGTLFIHSTCSNDSWVIMERVRLEMAEPVL
jgi:hypothetical protein